MGGLMAHGCSLRAVIVRPLSSLGGGRCAPGTVRNRRALNTSRATHFGIFAAAARKLRCSRASDVSRRTVARDTSLVCCAQQECREKFATALLMLLSRCAEEDARVGQKTVTQGTRSGEQMDAADFSRNRIAAAHALIEPYVRRTPVVEVDAFDFGLAPGISLTLKLELLQHTGSFKPRGAFTNLLQRPVPSVGVVAASGGNHGAAVAFAAMRLGVPAKI